MKELFSHKVIMGVLALVVAAGGSYGGYEVAQKYGKYGTNFDKRAHLVTEVVDGDTFVIEDGIRIRMLNVDAPETGECYGAEAKENLVEGLLGREVVLEKDQSARDNYGRLLRYVFTYEENPETDSELVNAEVVRQGFALEDYVSPNRRYLSQIQAGEREAQEEGVGIWGECDIAENKAERSDREQDSEPFSDECVIKGNISKNFTKDYFLPGCPNYKRVKVDPRKGEKWFCTEEDAREDGWQKSDACNNIWQTRD